MIFRKKKSRFFPDDSEGRRSTIHAVHREIAGDDLVKDRSVIDLVLEQISDEEDPFYINAYLIYYVGYYKPFEKGNEATAKALADGILSDHGYFIPQDEVAMKHIAEGCNGVHTIDDIVDWQRKHAVRTEGSA